MQHFIIYIIIYIPCISMFSTLFSSLLRTPDTAEMLAESAQPQDFSAGDGTIGHRSSRAQKPSKQGHCNQVIVSKSKEK
ncbi:hypothetical protein EON63_10955 [archaeon]|nr:MAG: hypothetical protein EON63_10955 [archaeon]